MASEIQYETIIAFLCDYRDGSCGFHDGRQSLRCPGGVLPDDLPAHVHHGGPDLHEEKTSHQPQRGLPEAAARVEREPDGGTR